ncbi:MAG: hypothetical protein ACHQNV_10090 [Vicinamibacteria bacterium]
MTLLDKARAGQNALEQIANVIPGFKGYRDRELRRDADRLEREHLAARLEECKKPLNEAAAAVSRSGNLDGINDIETARKRLDKVIARIRHADRGYSGFFDAVKVDEAALARVYEFDLGMAGDVDQIQAAAGDVKVVLARIDALDARFADREAILAGIK